MRGTERLRAILLAVFVTVLWSFSWVLIKISLADIPPLTFAGFRYMLAALVLLPGLRKNKDQLRSLSGRDWLNLVILGLFFYTITQGGQFLALNLLDTVTVSLLLNFTTVLVAFFGMIVLKEKPSILQWVGIAVFIAGVLVYFSPSIKLTGKPLGFIVAGITVCGNAVATLLGRSINRQKRIPPMVVTEISMGIGAIVLLSAGLVVEDFPRFDLWNVLVIIWLGVVHTALAFNLWNKSLQVLSAVESSIINNTMLIQIALLAWVFLKEKPGFIEVIGLTLAAAGVFLAQTRKSIKPDDSAA
jgi:O-acetylserine/cysteine efflux transporter